LRNAFVLKGGLEAWKSQQDASHPGDIGSSTTTAKLA
jgi:hypothetical protein